MENNFTENKYSYRIYRYISELLVDVLQLNKSLKLVSEFNSTKSLLINNIIKEQNNILVVDGRDVRFLIYFKVSNFFNDFEGVF